MGSAASTHEGIRKEWMAVFHAMQFTTHEVMKFYDIYNSIDTDHSGSIDVVELLKFLDIEASLFTERIFAAFDKDGTGKIDFFEFVVSLWKFCALGKESINVFAFDLFDTDGDGALTEIEVKVMFHDLYWYKTTAKENEDSRAALAELLSSGVGFITIEEFRPFCQTHENMLVPLFEVQNKLREAAMGPAFWDGMAKRKIQLSHGHKVELGELMVRSSDREDFNNILRERSRGIRSMMRALIETAEHTLHFGGAGHDDEHHDHQQHHHHHAPSTSEKSLSRLFNPFRNLGSVSHDSRDKEQQLNTSNHSKGPPSVVPTEAHGDSCDLGTIGQ